MKKILLGVGLLLVLSGAGYYMSLSKSETANTQVQTPLVGDSPTNTVTATKQNTETESSEELENEEPEAVKTATTAPTPTPVTKPATTSTVPATKTFTLKEVRTHNTPANCYSAISGVVYNLTAWINQHPGGDQTILSICGKDGTSAYTGQHSGQRQPATILAGFEVGTLVN